MAPKPTHICTQCLSQVRPKKITKGHFLLEVFLWMLLILPGILYSLWRLSSRYVACPVCEAPNTVPLKSPAGQKLLSQG